MRRLILLDTGPLVALLDRRDRYHAWARAQWAEIEPPLLTCEAILSEACFLLRKIPPGGQAVMELADRGIVAIPFHLKDHAKRVAGLVKRYATVPMSLADGCLICMSEMLTESKVLTVDRDFRLYRRHGRQVVPIIMPGDGSPWAE